VSYHEFVNYVIKAVEALGVAIMVVGGLAAFLAAIPASLDAERRPGSYVQVRRALGHSILLGLEVLILADIIRTIVVDQTFQSVVVLGVIVIVRIVLSFSLEVEIDHSWPWQRSRSDA
jgi:uncharacterized membrane protein